MAARCSFVLFASCEPPVRFPRFRSGPTALGTADKDTPTLTPFLPDPATGAAFVVCPGGGDGVLAAHEGAGGHLASTVLTHG